MQAILLAAGYGNRMRPLTDERHKTLLTIGGQTIITRILDGLWQNGVKDVAIVTGYRADELRAHVLEHHPKFCFTFVHNPRYRETNNIHSLTLALQQLPIDDDVVLVETDLVCAPEVFSRIIHTPHANAALLDRWRLGMEGTVVTIEGGLVHQVIPPHLQVGDFSFRDKFKTVNIYKFSKEFCRTQFRQLLTFYAHTFDDNCYYELILGILIYMRQADIHAEVIDGLPWSEVDDPNDVRLAEFVFDKPARRRILNESMGGYWSHEITDFSFIRNMHFPTGAVLSEVRANLSTLLQNYGSSQKMLDQKLAYLLLVDVHRLHVLNGASQLYPFLGRCWGQKKALLPSPTFGEYPRWFARRTTYRDGPGFDTVEIETRAEDAELVVFVNPNNPVGSILPTQWIFDFAHRHAGTQIMVDESFLEFSNQPSILTLLEQTPLANVLVLKSLSKSLGIPGVRLGWSYTCDPALQQEIGEALPIWNLNSIAEHLLEILPKHRRSMDESFVRTVADREAFAAALCALHCVERVDPSAANFLLVTMRQECVPEGGWVPSLLASHNIFVKDVSDRFDDRGVRLRLAVRLPYENLALCQAMAATAPSS